MKKLFCVMLCVMCLTGWAWAAETSGDVENSPSLLFEEGRQLHRQGKDTDAMITWKKAVEAGDGRAAMWIGILYERGGKGIAQDFDNAIKWYQKSKELGYPGGSITLGFAYLNGKGVVKDVVKAYECVHEVEDVELESDDIVSKNAYRFYVYGWGTNQDLKKAYEIASRISDEEARKEAFGEIAQVEEISRPIPANTLISEIEKNQMRFDKNYKDKRFTAEGFVGSIEEGRNGYVLKLFGEQGFVNPFKHIECRFDKSQEDALFDLNKGDKIKVEGTYRGKQNFQVGSMLFYDCTIVK